MVSPTEMAKPRFSAVAFDLDGTLYPASGLYVRLVPFLLKNQRLLRVMGRVRNRLRKSGAYSGDFYELQAHLMGEVLGEPSEIVKEKTERLIYRGWEPFFKTIKLFPHLRETLDAFRGAGIPMGLLSDFPTEGKLQNMGLADYWNATHCSEQSGRLKPDPLSFLELAEKMGERPENMLYVGNNPRYDVKGAAAAGMSAALILPRWRKCPAALRKAAFVFHGYRQLRDYVLN